jgi:hypothetical protein
MNLFRKHTLTLIANGTDPKVYASENDRLSAWNCAKKASALFGDVSVMADKLQESLTSETGGSVREAGTKIVATVRATAVKPKEDN